MWVEKRFFFLPGNELVRLKTNDEKEKENDDIKYLWKEMVKLYKIVEKLIK